MFHGPSAADAGVSAHLAARARGFVAWLESNGCYRYIKYENYTDPTYSPKPVQPIYTHNAAGDRIQVGTMPVPDPPQLRRPSYEGTLISIRDTMTGNGIQTMAERACDILMEVYYACHTARGSSLTADWWGLNMDRMEIIAVFAKCRHDEDHPITRVDEFVEIDVAIDYIYSQKAIQLGWNSSHKKMVELKKAMSSRVSLFM